MINVLHIINGASIGGISSMLLNYYRAIDRSKVHFDFVYSAKKLGYNGYELIKLGSKFYYIPKKSDSIFQHCRELKKILKNNRYDAIHVHSNHTSYVDLRIAKKMGIKIRVAHAHNAIKGQLTFEDSLSRLLGIVLINRYATKKLACSEDAAVYVFGRLSIKKPNLCVLPNAIPSCDFFFNSKARSIQRKTLKINEDEIAFGTVGRMTWEKNQIFLLDVLKELRKKHSCKLILIGDGPEMPKVIDYAKQIEALNSVLILGARTDVNLLINCFDVFTIPSKHEGFSIAGLEAGANGLPILMSTEVPVDLGFLPNTKYLELSSGPKAWSDAIYELSRKKRVDSHGIIFEKGYDIQSAARKLEYIYGANE